MFVCPYIYSDFASVAQNCTRLCPGLDPQTQNPGAESPERAVFWSLGESGTTESKTPYTHSFFCTFAASCQDYLCGIFWGCVASVKLRKSIIILRSHGDKFVMAQSNPHIRKRPKAQETQPLLTLNQVQAFFQSNSHQYGLFLSLVEASEISGNTPGTPRKHVSEGRYDQSVLRGKPLRFLRDQFCLDVLNRPTTARTTTPLRSSTKSASRRKGGA